MLCVNTWTELGPATETVVFGSSTEEVEASPIDLLVLGVAEVNQEKREKAMPMDWAGHRDGENKAITAARRKGHSLTLIYSMTRKLWRLLLSHNGEVRIRKQRTGSLYYNRTEYAG